MPVEHSKSQGKVDAASKNGIRHSIYWVRKNPAYLAAQRLKTDNKKVSSYVSSKMYKGSWKNNKKDGFGKLQYANGNCYEGEWKAGRKHGKGTFWVSLCL